MSEGKWFVLFIFLKAYLLTAVFVPQAGAAINLGYPRGFNLSGVAEITYRQFSSESSSVRSRASESSRFEQKLRLNLHGHIWKPKFAVFTAGVTLRNADFKSRSSDSNSKNIGYDVRLRFFPYRVTSLSLYASKFDYTTDGSSAFSSYDATSKTIGGTLVFAKSRKFIALLNYQKWQYETDRLVTRPERPDEGGDPFMDNFYYGHDYYDDEFEHAPARPIKWVTKRVTERYESTRYGIGFIGLISSVNTHYRINYDNMDYSTPFSKLYSRSLSANVYTVMKKNFSISNLFSYFDNTISKSLSLTSTVRINTVPKLSQTYGYEYYRVSYKDSRQEDSQSQAVRASLHYRFSARLRARADLYYRLTKIDGVSENFGTAGIDYSGPIKDTMNLAAYYRFSAEKSDIERADFNDHRAGFKLSTRTLRWGELYAHYIFSYRIYNMAGKSTQHSLLAGVKGRGPGRLTWNLENEYSYRETTGYTYRIPVPEGYPYDMGDYYDYYTGYFDYFDTDDEEGREYVVRGMKTQYNTVKGRISYPFSRVVRLHSSSSYTFGTAGSRNYQRFAFQGRINYNILRNLSLHAWWMEQLTDSEGFRKRRVSTQNLEIEYRLRKLFVSLDYRIVTTDSGLSELKTKYLFLRVRRPI